MSRAAQIELQSTSVVGAQRNWDWVDAKNSTSNQPQEFPIPSHPLLPLPLTARASSSLRPSDILLLLASVRGKSSHEPQFPLNCPSRLRDINSLPTMLSVAIRRRLLAPTHNALRTGFAAHVVRHYASFPEHQVVKMPALSPTMQHGNIGSWQKKPGDSIAPGDVLVEIETDKAQMDFEFQEEGVIAKILKESGEKDVPVGSPIAVLVEEGTDISAFEKFSIEDAGGAAAPAAPKQEKTESKSEPSSTPASTPEPEQYTSSEGRLQTALDREPNMSAAAKRLARENGISVDGLKGTGQGGKITEEDVKKAISSPAVAAPGATFEDIPISGMRKTIANRLVESTQTNPHFYVTSSVSVSKLLKLRQALNSSADGKYKLSVNDFLIKAMAIASRKVPQVNSSWREGNIRQFSTVDVSVAVSTPTGLITPIVTGVEGRGLEAISSKVKELAKKARDGKLKPEEYQGGTISISNMGMNPAVDHFTAVINPPQAAILAVGTTRKVAVPAQSEDGGVEFDDQITLTASFDHKVVDGAVGAEWLRELKQVLENPLELLL
ncbi:Dihydrolipoyllysine-residue acetyltransferase component of pyruvate dehydrogenase complex, mitochondrial [Fusarium kuroshium]|uniref:Acetyltransferase component of pyruvate dehydrogenase complex n=2 Tax=Fusarium solani species complex TaxID=232080 RepID=A0A3M2RY61_9HYPO|nr:Dihydrolipoyllysine-residue acetyltransferase component of pyruvate dehydrogenase complex, mitochondrial [Fusarium kuroshium]